MSTLKAYLELMRFHKPIGTLLLLWPTLWALWLASAGKPNLHVLCVLVLGVIIMRAAGCVMNDVADIQFDAHVERTQARPLVTNRVSKSGALILFVTLLVSAFLLVITLNTLTIMLAFIAACLAILYPFMKRYTYWPQLFLGLAFNFGIPMAYAAQLNHVPSIAWQLYSAAILWTLAYDTQYAMVDRADDIQIGIKSTAILFGRYDKIIIGLFQFSFLILLCLIGVQLKLSWMYHVSLAIALVFMVYQQWLIKNRERMHCFRAFLNNNWVGAVIFVGIAGGYFVG